MKVNGLDVRLAPTEANVICGAITGKGYSNAGGGGVSANPYMGWDGTRWTVIAGTVAPMQNVTCNR
jgi:hypothetical protein